MDSEHDLVFEWLHLSYDETSEFTETYGFTGSQGIVQLEGILIRPKGIPSDQLLIYMHPASTLQLLPVPRAAAQMGAHILCGASRYARNDTAAILEKVVLDLGAYVRHARDVLGYAKIVLVGWSGGGSLSLFYQSQAERPTITHTPAGDRVDLVAAKLIPADAVVFQAAHVSRARLLLESIDPSVRDEADPDNRDIGLDIYAPAGPRAPYSADFMVEFREAQANRVRRITAWVKEMLATLAERGGAEVERCFITHRTLADPRFLDASIDPNDRQIGHCYLGVPETVNSGPVGLARSSTLRAWLSQWSFEDTNADSVRSARSISVPFLAMENSADDAVPKLHVAEVFNAVTSNAKQMILIKGANHYYGGQPEILYESTRSMLKWLETNIGDR